MEQFFNEVNLLLDGKALPVRAELDVKQEAEFIPMTKVNVGYIVYGIALNDFGQVLMMQEAKPSCYGKWYLPAGRLEPNESLSEGVKREVKEETGMVFEPETLLDVLSVGRSYHRFAFIGEVSGGSLKTVQESDEESLQAAWVPVEKVLKEDGDYPLRAPDIIDLIKTAQQRQDGTLAYKSLLPITNAHTLVSLRILLVCGSSYQFEILCGTENGLHLPEGEFMGYGKSPLNTLLKLGDSRGRLAAVASMQSIDQDDLSLAASAHGFYAKTKATSPKWPDSFGPDPPLANNEGSWAEWGTLNSVNTFQRSEHNGEHHGNHQVHPTDGEVDATDHGHKGDLLASPGNTSRVAFVFDDDPGDHENYYRRQARLHQKKYGSPTYNNDQTDFDPVIHSVPHPLDNPGAPRVKSLICAGQEIATFMDLVWPFIGILGYCLDVGSDVALMLEYLISELYTWFALTMVFVALPTIAMTVLSAVLWARNYKVLKEKVSPVQWTMRVTSSIFLSTPIMRMVDIFYYGWQSRNTTHDWYTRRMFFERMIDEETECALVRLFETFLENAPQLVLQLYIIMMVGTSRGLVLVLFQVIGLVISWLQMSVSLVSFHTVLRASLQPEKARMTWGGRICMFLWRMFTIASRVVALALFASHFHFYVFVFVGGHFLIMFIWIFNQDSSYCQLRRRTTDGKEIIHDGQVSEILFRFVVAIVHVFCFINLLEGPTRLRYFFYYVVMFVENLTMVILWYTWGGTVAETTWYHGPALAIVIGGFILGIMFQVVYYMWFHPNNHNAGYADRKIPCCRPCSEMSVIRNVVIGMDEESDDEEEEYEVVKQGTHIEPMSRPPTSQSNRELQPGYSGQIDHDDNREMMNYQPAQLHPNNRLNHTPMVKQPPKSYFEKSRSPPRNGQTPPHHPLNRRHNSYNPDDTPLPPGLQQGQNSVPQRQNHAPQRQNNTPQRQNNTPQRQNNIPNDMPHRRSYLAVGRGKGNISRASSSRDSVNQENVSKGDVSRGVVGRDGVNQGNVNKGAVSRGGVSRRGSSRGRQWGQAMPQQPLKVNPCSSQDSANNTSALSFNVSKSTTV